MFRLDFLHQTDSLLHGNLRQMVALFVRRARVPIFSKARPGRHVLHQVAGLFALLQISSGLGAATYSVNVYVSSAAASGAKIQSQFIANTTGYFKSTLVASPYYANTYTLTLYDVNPSTPPPTSAPQTLSDEINYLVKITSDTYLYGFAFGMENERAHDVGLLNDFSINCSTPSYFASKISTAAWNSSVCLDTLAAGASTIYNQYFSTPTAPPGF